MHSYIGFFKYFGFWQILTEKNYKTLLPWILLNGILMIYFIGFMQIVQFINLLLYKYDLVKFVERMVCSITYMEVSHEKFLF